MATSHIHTRPPGIETVFYGFALAATEVVAAWMAFLALNPSSSTYSEYLLNLRGAVWSR
jgi:hypothetical protein